MVTLRATRKVLKALERQVECGDSDTALGDWYVNRIVVNRKPLLLLVSSNSLLAIVTWARGVRTLPERLTRLVEDRLRRLPIPEPLVHSEVTMMDRVCVGPTASRSILGSMVDFAYMISVRQSAPILDDAGLAKAEVELAGMPCRVSSPSGRVIWPGKRAREVLAAKWAGESFTSHPEPL